MKQDAQHLPASPDHTPFAHRATPSEGGAQNYQRPLVTDLGAWQALTLITSLPFNSGISSN